MTTALSTPTRGNSGTVSTLVCVAALHSEVTAPTFTWLKGSSAATETPETPVVAGDSSSVTSKLPITFNSDSDNKVYKCVATYSGLAAGSTIESSTTVIMNKMAPSTTETVKKFVGQQVVLSCVATAANTVDIKWRKKAAEYTDQ